MSDSGAVYFDGPESFRAWLEAHHETATAIVVGFYKKGSGIPSMTWPESVDEALCVGWIDGHVKGVDEIRYTRRFTPRTATSIWSAVNIRRFAELVEQGRVRPAGHEAFGRRTEDRSRVYSHERDTAATLAPDEERAFRRNRAAWKDFEARSATYRRQALHWVVSAKREDTRRRRLETLISACAAGEIVPPLRWSRADKRS